jgi:hypothetical protein
MFGCSAEIYVRKDLEGVINFSNNQSGSNVIVYLILDRPMNATVYGIPRYRNADDVSVRIDMSYKCSKDYEKKL